MKRSEKQDAGDPLRPPGTIILTRDGIPPSPASDLFIQVGRWIPSELLSEYPSSLIKRAIAEARRYSLSEPRDIAAAVLDSLMRHEAGVARALGRRRAAIRRARRTIRQAPKPKP